MRTDPRVACTNAHERLGWAIVHDLIAHPLMAVTNWSRPALRFHDWTSVRAWPRTQARPLSSVAVPTVHWGVLQVQQKGDRIWSINHPTIDHTLVVSADDAIAAAEQAEQWFDGLADEFGGKFGRIGMGSV